MTNANLSNGNFTEAAFRGSRLEGTTWAGRESSRVDEVKFDDDR